MKIFIKPLAIAATLIATTATIALGQAWTPDEIANGLKKEELARYVKSGSKTTLYFFVVAEPDCSPIDGYEVALTKPPTHGTVEFEPSKEFGKVLSRKANELKHLQQGANTAYCHSKK